ncbi:MAG TPA: hypothetical protein VGM37_02785 [Armatimonadota bacterium]|jgi:hypothetical protein
MMRANTALAAALLALTAQVSRAEWLGADLPYADGFTRPLTGVAAAGPSDVWAVAPYDYEFQDDKTRVRWNTAVYHSINDGLLWELPLDAPVSEPSFNKYPFQDVQLFAAAFADRDNGWLFGWRRPNFDPGGAPGDYAFYHTTDRGHTWTETTLPNAGTLIPDPPDFAISAVSPTHALAVEGRHVFETLDGAAWRERTAPYPMLSSIQATGLTTPRVAGTDGQTALGGRLTATGVSTEVRGAGAFLATAFAGDAAGWVAGTGGAILGTVDGGATWKSQATVSGATFHGLSAPDAAHAWAVGERTASGAKGLIMRTANSGATWTHEFSPPGRLFCVAFRDAYHGWACGDGGLFRYVPDTPGRAYDLDGNRQTDRIDVAAGIARAGGLAATGPPDVRAEGGPVSIVSAVAALKSVASQSALVTADRARRVVIVYNTAAGDTDGDGEPDGRQVAEHYAAKRGVPAANLIPVTWADTESFYSHSMTDGGGRANWTDAYHAVVEPLKARIDELGRENVDTILFTFGMPFQFYVTGPNGYWERIPLDTAVMDLYRTDAENWSSAPSYFAPPSAPAYRYARSRFGVGGRPMGQPAADANGAVSRDPVYLVSRIDGPSVASCEAMVDNAILAEASPGLDSAGTAYIDTRASNYNGGPYDLAALRAWTPDYSTYAHIDASIARTILTFSERGIPWRDEVTYAEIGGSGSPRWRDGEAATSAPNALFYAGWYNYGVYHDVFQWLPGSVAIDYDSSSAARFRQGDYFAGGALAHGVTCLVGVIDEPYQYHPKPDALMEYIARGFSFAEAALLSMDTPRTARALFLGDPLYAGSWALPR